MPSAKLRYATPTPVCQASTAPYPNTAGGMAAAKAARGNALAAECGGAAAGTVPDAGGAAAGAASAAGGAAAGAASAADGAAAADVRQATKRASRHGMKAMVQPWRA